MREVVRVRRARRPPPHASRASVVGTQTPSSCEFSGVTPASSVSGGMKKTPKSFGANSATSVREGQAYRGGGADAFAKTRAARTGANTLRAYAAPPAGVRGQTPR